MWFSQEGLRILKKRIKLKTPRLILCFRIPAVSVAVEDCVLGLLRSSLCVWLCYRDLGVFLSIEQPIFNIQGSLPMTDLTWKGSPEEEESKESEMTRSEVRGIVLLFVCSVSLSWKALFFGLDKLLNFWTGLFELTHSHHPKGPIALLAYRCDRKQSIASQRSSLKLLSPEFLLAFSYIGVVDNISTILPCLHVGLISPRGSNPHTSSDFVGLCEMTNLPTWVIPLLK